MPYNVVDGDEFDVTFVTLYEQTQAGNNSFRIRAVVAPGMEVTDQQVINTLGFIVGPLYKAYLASNCRYSGATIRRVLGGGDQPKSKWSVVEAGVGLSDPPVLPRQAALLLSLYTDLAGRKYRGRTYWPFIPSEYLSADGTPAPVLLGLVDSITTVILADTNIPGAGINVITVQFGLHPAGGTWQQFRTALLHDQFATQRPRSDFGQMNKSPFT